MKCISTFRLYNFDFWWTWFMAFYRVLRPTFFWTHSHDTSWFIAMVLHGISAVSYSRQNSIVAILSATQHSLEAGLVVKGAWLIPMFPLKKPANRLDEDEDNDCVAWPDSWNWYIFFHLNLSKYWPELVKCPWGWFPIFFLRNKR